MWRLCVSWELMSSLMTRIRRQEEVIKDVDGVLDMVGEDVLRPSFQVVKRSGLIISLLPRHKE
jgi:NADPH:quinone reductase-like Zn-dependent oxidoreductase